MSTGNIGESLRKEEDVTHTYLSKDGGLTWNEVHREPMIYEFGDHGGIIIMASLIKDSNEILYSWNEGEKW